MNANERNALGEALTAWRFVSLYSRPERRRFAWQVIREHSDLLKVTLTRQKTLTGFQGVA